MKITAIKTANFIGDRNVDIRLDSPVTLICGRNHSGKSSLAEAVRMALTGESVRVRLKKDYGLLITEGQTVGYAVVDHDGERSAITLPNGAHEHTGQSRPPAILPFILDAQRFASLDTNERRSFLFGLTGLRTDGDAVTQRLLAKGCNAARVEEISPHLRGAGFDAAHKEAQANARESKAAWRAITSETYGSVKAASWKAQKPARDANRLRLVREELGRVSEQIEKGVADLAVMQSAAARQAQQSEKISGLRERAGRYARIEAKLRKDEAELKEWQEKVEIEERRGKQMPTEPTYTCPKCSATLRHDHANGALVEFTPPPIVSHPEPEKLAEYQKARDLLARSVENDKRDLAAADLAARTLAEIDDARSDPAPSPEEIEAKKAQLAEARKEQKRLAGVVKALEADERAAAIADEKTDLARSHHHDVVQWELIADALAPSGIQGEMLAEALEPINDRLARSANETEWLRVGIDADMGISADGGRPYALLSESERWRADAMIAEAVSHLSGVRLLVLDRVDVLDLAGREDLLYWLDGLAADGEIDTALLFATLKALPANIPKNIEAIWIENGIAGKVRSVA